MLPGAFAQGLDIGQKGLSPLIKKSAFGLGDERRERT
jgi:hypothetical protein